MNLKRLSFTLLFTLLCFLGVAQKFSFFQPQEKRDSILPEFEQGYTASYQIEYQREVIENEEKTKSLKIKSAFAIEIQSVDKEQVTLNFILPKNHFFQRVFNPIFSFENNETQPVAINLTLDKRTKFLSINNYADITKILVKELDILRKTDTLYDSKTYFNAIEKLQFDIKNGDEKLMRTAFLDLVYYFTAYSFPINKKEKINFYRSDYEYFATSRACISEYQKFGTKEFFTFRYNRNLDDKPKPVVDTNILDFNLRYSVYFDAKKLPQSVGLFLLQKRTNEKIIETWTLLKI